MEDLLEEIRGCTICAEYLPLGPNPILAASTTSKIIIIGQAPGAKVHASSIPWDDKSGDRLRSWLNVSRDTFYDPDSIALLPMGFCYPGKGRSGDLPPRSECAPQWHDKVLRQLPEKHLTILIGNYAQKYYLGDRAERTLTETVKNFMHYLPEIAVLPHPSPRNNIWLRRNAWFEEKLLPELQCRVGEVL